MEAIKKPQDMKKQHTAIETMVETQTKLVDTFTTNAMKAMEVFRMEDNWSKKGKEIYEDYLKEHKAMAEKAMQPATYEKGMEAVTEQMVKAMEMQWQFATRTMDFYREQMMSMTEGHHENPMNRMMELFHDNMHAMVDATKKNMEALRIGNWN